MAFGVDLLVVDHQTPSDLEAMLNSIGAGAAGVDVAVWVGLVEPEQASRDVARRWLDETGREGKVVEWLENVGFNRAINRLGTLGEHPVIGCLNADVELSPKSILEIAAPTLENEEWGVVGPRQVDRRGRLTAAGIFGSPSAPRHRGWHDWEASGRYCDVRDDAIYVAGSALFLRRDVWDQLTACPIYRRICEEPGPWLPCQHFYGDSFLSSHAKAHGHRAVYLGTTTIVHQCGARSSPARDRADRALFREACASHGIDHE